MSIGIKNICIKLFGEKKTVGRHFFIGFAHLFLRSSSPLVLSRPTGSVRSHQNKPLGTLEILQAYFIRGLYHFSAKFHLKTPDLLTSFKSAAAL